MHRSSTSMVARSIHKQGEVHMGDKLLLGLPDNPKGHYENKKFLHLNIDILKAAGGSWDNPPSKKEILKVAPLFKDRIKRLISESEEEANAAGYISWGFKDPRACLTIDLYMPYLNNPQFIICYRDPMEIARSLNKRDKMSITDGVNLVKIYNNRIFDFIKNNLKKI